MQRTYTSYTTMIHAIAFFTTGFASTTSHQAVVERQCRYDCLVALASFLELGHVQRPILILIHHAKDLLHALLRRVLVLGQFYHRAHHLVDGLDNRQHLVVADLPVAVDIVQLERPVELVLHLPPARHR